MYSPEGLFTFCILCITDFHPCCHRYECNHKPLSSGTSWAPCSSDPRSWPARTWRAPKIVKCTLLCLPRLDIVMRYNARFHAKLPTALVLSIPISGPALTCIPQWVSLEMVEPTVLVTPRVKAPAWKWPRYWCRSLVKTLMLTFLQYLNAKRVSAVSPDCEIRMHTSSLEKDVF